MLVFCGYFGEVCFAQRWSRCGSGTDATFCAPLARCPERTLFPRVDLLDATLSGSRSAASTLNVLLRAGTKRTIFSEEMRNLLLPEFCVPRVERITPTTQAEKETGCCGGVPNSCGLQTQNSEWWDSLLTTETNFFLDQRLSSRWRCRGYRGRSCLQYFNGLRSAWPSIWVRYCSNSRKTLTCMSARGIQGGCWSSRKLIDSIGFQEDSILCLRAGRWRFHY